MTRKRSESELQFFETGVKTWLDVEDALTEFRRQVQERCEEVAKARLPDLCQTCKIEWTEDNLQDYHQYTTDGRYLGKKLVVEGLGRLYFYLGAYRDQGALLCGMWVCLWRKRSNLAVDLWALAGKRKIEQYGNELYFGEPAAQGQVPELEEHLNQAIDAFVALVTEAGGLEKSVVAGGAASA